MRFDKTASLTAFILLSVALFAQSLSAQSRPQETFGLEPGQTPVLETSLGYTFIHANAPPGQCGCFSANGGYASIVVHMPRNLAVVADFAAAHTNAVGATTQSITVFNYLFGPRYTFRPIFKRYMLYGQALGGGSQELSSYAAIHNPSGAALSVGGGASTTLNPHFGWTIIEADWVHSFLPNAQNNIQNDLRVSTGFTFRLGPR